MEVPPPWDRQEKPRGHEGIQNDLYDILGWRDTKRTAIALSVCWGVWYFLILGASNVVTSICRLCLCLMVVGVFHRTGIAPGVFQLVNGAVRTLYPVLVWSNTKVSAATLVGSLVFMFIFRSLSYSTGFLLLIILAFGISPFFLRQDLKNIVLKKEETESCRRAVPLPTTDTGARARSASCGSDEQATGEGRPPFESRTGAEAVGVLLVLLAPLVPRPAAQLKPPNLARRRHLKPRKEPCRRTQRAPIPPAPWQKSLRHGSIEEPNSFSAQLGALNLGAGRNEMQWMLSLPHWPFLCFSLHVHCATPCISVSPQKMEVPPPWDRQEKPRGHEGIQNDLYDILGWRDTKRTAIALSVCWGVWYFLILGASNVVTSICRLCLCLMVVGVFHRTGIAPGVLPEQRLLRAHDAVFQLVNGAVRTLYPVLVWSNTKVSAATLVGSLVFMFIFRSLSYSTGFLLLIILAFGISPFFLRQDLKNIVLKKVKRD
eukprot:gene560-306_t